VAFANPPAGFTTFQTTDEGFVLWFAVRDARRGDIAASEYYTPAGQFYGATSGEWSPVQEGGNVCFEDTPFYIAGEAPSRLPGEWRIRVIYNNQILTEIRFTIQQAGGSGGGGTAPTGVNLLQNGDAEAGGAAPGCSLPATIPGWTTDGGMGWCRYGTGGYPDRNSPGPANRGNNFFGGAASAQGNIQQTIDLSGSAAAIDAGTQGFTLEGYLGGYAEQRDNAVLRVNFLSATGAGLGSAQIGPVTAAERNNVTGLFLRRTTGVIPRNTRRAIVTLTTQRLDGSDNDGYADNLVFALGAATDAGGGSSGTLVQFVELRGGAYSNNTYSPSSEVWDTDPGSSFWVLGVSNPSLTATLLNTTTAPGINLAPGTYYIYGEPTTFGSAVRLTIRWSNGVSEQAVFAVGSLTRAEVWTRLTGASNIGLSSTGLTANRVGGGNNAVTPAGGNDFVLQLVIGAPGTVVDGGGGSGGGGGGGTLPPTCNYMLSSTSTSLPGTRATGLVRVTTAATCTWTARSNADWITIDAGQSGTGSGAVSFSVPANPATTPRTGTLTIAGQTHTVTQAGGQVTPTCTYEILPTSASFAAAGGTGSLAVTASAATCAWTATSNVAWITITAGTPGSGNGTVRYTVAANSATASRTGTLTVAGRTFTVTQAGASAGGPAINAGGIVNAGSYISSDFPNGGIARGSFFSIFGTNLGPAQFAQATEYPLRTTLGGVTIRVTVGSTTVEAIPVFVSNTQINGILPSTTPVGEGTLVVTYNGRSSAPMAIKVVNSNFGAFTTAAGRGPGIFQNYINAAEQPLNTTANAAHRLQVVTLWGTGLGPITAPDTLAPPAGDLPVNVEILVGGYPARKLYAGRAPCCAGVDQIVFEIPREAPLGCYVPVQIRVAGVASPPVTISLAEGSQCSDPHNPFGELATKGGKAGILVLARIAALAQVEAGQAPLDLTLDIGSALFVNQQAGGELGYNPALSLPPLGSCTAFSGALDANALLGSATGGDTASLTPGATWLDAGPRVTVSGAKGTIALEPIDEDKGGSPYIGLLGGSLPLEGAPSLPLFLEAGGYTLSAPGGKDVAAFTSNFTIPAPLVWTNRDQLTEINRSAGLTFRWTPGNANQVSVLLAGASTDQTTKASAGFYCLAPANTGQFTVPATILSGLPPTRGTSLEDSAGAVIFATIPNGAEVPKFSARGLDYGIVLSGTISLRTVTVR
jgi:uncharacterized protein (TIGR03437 family)